MTIENLIIYTQRPGADSPKEIKRALDCRRLATTGIRGVRTVPRASLVVNWGGSRVPDWAAGRDVRYLNNPTAVRRKVSKVGQIQRFVAAGVPTFEVTTERRTAQQWLRDGQRVLGRADGGFGGRGIVVYEGGRELVEEHDFYSRYFAKTHEYRVHVFAGQVIDLVQKKKRAGVGEGRTLTERVVRSWDNGWIFAHNDLHLPGDSRVRIGRAAVDAVRAVGLDFGAVDVLADFGPRDGGRLRELAVCEVNSAPGLENTATIKAYATAIEAVYRARV